jgi:hypothetical protein
MNATSKVKSLEHANATQNNKFQKHFSSPGKNSIANGLHTQENGFGISKLPSILKSPGATTMGFGPAFKTSRNSNS